MDDKDDSSSSSSSEDSSPSEVPMEEFDDEDSREFDPPLPKKYRDTKNKSPTAELNLQSAKRNINILVGKDSKISIKLNLDSSRYVQPSDSSKVTSESGEKIDKDNQKANDNTEETKMEESSEHASKDIHEEIRNKATEDIEGDNKIVDTKMSIDEEESKDEGTSAEDSSTNVKDDKSKEEIEKTIDENDEIKSGALDDVQKKTAKAKEEEASEDQAVKEDIEDKSEDKTTKEDTEDKPEDNAAKEKTEEETEDKPEDKKTESSEYDPKNVHYEGEIAIYTEPKSGYQYKWCKDTNQWLEKGGVTYGFEDDTHTYTDTEGAKYFWDVDKNAWFPKIDDDFMARYQMSYGFVDNKTEDTDKVEEKEDKDVKDTENIDEKKIEAKDVKNKGIKRKAEQPPPSWFEINDQQNTKVYVSNLPTDITEEEFVDLMQKCGLVMRDVQTQKMKIKLYSVPGTDILKGDALCTYIKIESVELALKILDGYVYRGKTLKVERAKFEMKGDYNPSLKPKKKKKDKEKIKKMQQKLFDWRPEKMRGERSKHERVVIIKNLFEPSLFDREVQLILEYQQDLREECSKCGDVRRVVLYDRHPEGVAQITMREPEEADACVTLLNGRWFGQRKLTAEIWDGKTKYKIGETEAQIGARIDNWEHFLEEDDDPKSAKNEKDLKEKKEDIPTEKKVPDTKA